MTEFLVLVGVVTLWTLAVALALYAAYLAEKERKP